MLNKWVTIVEIYSLLQITHSVLFPHEHVYGSQRHIPECLILMKWRSIFIGQKALNMLFLVPAGCGASMGIYKGITLFAMETISDHSLVPGLSITIFMRHMEPCLLYMTIEWALKNLQQWLTLLWNVRTKSICLRVQLFNFTITILSFSNTAQTVLSLVHYVH